jgi:hypothetical protein
MRIINQSETGAFATSELGSEAVNHDVSAVDLVFFGEFLTKLFFGNVGEFRMNDLQELGGRN